MKIESLSIFFPCFNDNKTIESLVSKGYKVVRKISRDFELIVVDDGSDKITKMVLSKLKKRYPALKTVTHRENKGYGAALKSGFNKASKKWVFYTDGDGQYNPLDLLRLVKKIDNHIDVVNGFKIKRNDSLDRVILGSLYNKLLHIIYSLPISDIDCDFRLIKRELLKNIHLKSNSGFICLELILKLKRKGAKFAEIGVNHYQRLHGTSQFFRPSSLIKTLLESLKFLIDIN